LSGRIFQGERFGPELNPGSLRGAVAGRVPTHPHGLIRRNPDPGYSRFPPAISRKRRRARRIHDQRQQTNDLCKILHFTVLYSSMVSNGGPFRWSPSYPLLWLITPIVLAVLTLAGTGHNTWTGGMAAVPPLLENTFCSYRILPRISLS